MPGPGARPARGLAPGPRPTSAAAPASRPPSRRAASLALLVVCLGVCAHFARLEARAHHLAARLQEASLLRLQQQPPAHAPPLLAGRRARQGREHGRVRRGGSGRLLAARTSHWRARAPAIVKACRPPARQGRVPEPPAAKGCHRTWQVLTTSASRSIPSAWSSNWTLASLGGAQGVGVVWAGGGERESAAGLHSSWRASSRLARCCWPNVGRGAAADIAVRLTPRRWPAAHQNAWARSSPASPLTPAACSAVWKCAASSLSCTGGGLRSGHAGRGSRQGRPVGRVGLRCAAGRVCGWWPCHRGRRALRTSATAIASSYRNCVTLCWVMPGMVGPASLGTTCGQGERGRAGAGRRCGRRPVCAGRACSGRGCYCGGRGRALAGYKVGTGLQPRQAPQSPGPPTLPAFRPSIRPGVRTGAMPPVLGHTGPPPSLGNSAQAPPGAVPSSACHGREPVVISQIARARAMGQQQ